MKKFLHSDKRGFRGFKGFKGFMHIVEIIIIGMLVFVTISQFSSIPAPKSEWPKTKLYLTGNDILFSLDKKGVNWFNETEVKYYLNETIPSSIIYNLEIKNAIKSKIKVGCFCDDNQYTDLNNTLKPNPFEINGNNIEFLTMKVTNLSEAFSLDFDVVVFYNYTNLVAYGSLLSNYLSYDKGMVEIFDFDPSIVDSVQNNTFGLGNGAVAPGGGGIKFSSESNNTDNEIYKIYKYFYHFPNSTGYVAYNPPYTFSNFLIPSETVKQRNDDDRKVLLIQDVTNVPACIVNYNIRNNNGRTVWLSKSGSLTEDQKVLIKSLIVWASVDKYNVVKNEIEGPVSVSFYKVYNDDMFQPVVINLKLGYLY